MSEETKICPYCGGIVLNKAKKCKHCGEWLVSVQNTEKSYQTKECPYCCQQIPVQAKKCPSCGEWVDRKENAAVGCLTESVMGCCGVIILILFVFGILFLAAGDSGIYLAMIAFYFLVGVAGLFLYFVPSVIANKNKHRHTIIIFVINLFFGWSIIGWIAMLIWALSDNH